MAERCTFTPKCPNESAGEAAVLNSLARLNVDLPKGAERQVRALRLVVVSALNAGACHGCALLELRQAVGSMSRAIEVAHA